MVPNTLKMFVENTIEGLQTKIQNISINRHDTECLSGLLNISFQDISGESLMHILDLKGICVSTGSACTSGANKPSYVLKSIGLTDEQALSSLRISYGHNNTLSDVQKIIDSIYYAYNKIKTGLK